MDVNVYDTVLDIDFATFKHYVYSEGQNIEAFPWFKLVVPSDSGQPLHSDHCLARTLEMLYIYVFPGGDMLTF